MTRQSHWLGGATVVASAAAIAIAAVAASPQPARADDCPSGGAVRFGVEPYDTAARLVPIYEKIGKLISDKVGCKVEVFVATGYNAEIEAMRNGKLELAEFGPLGYVLAHQVAKAEALAAFGAADGKPVTYWASVITYPSSGIKTDGDMIFLWKSDPIPTDPFAVRGDLPDALKKKLTDAVRHLDLMSLDPADRKILVGAGITQIVPQTDQSYDLIRDLVKTLNIDLAKLN